MNITFDIEKNSSLGYITFKEDDKLALFKIYIYKV